MSSQRLHPRLGDHQRLQSETCATQLVAAPLGNSKLEHNILIYNHFTRLHTSADIFLLQKTANLAFCLQPTAQNLQKKQAVELPNAEFVGPSNVNGILNGRQYKRAEVSDELPLYVTSEKLKAQFQMCSRVLPFLTEPSSWLGLRHHQFSNQMSEFGPATTLTFIGDCASGEVDAPSFSPPGRPRVAL